MTSGDLGIGTADPVKGFDVVAREGIVVAEQVIVYHVEEGLTLDLRDVGPQQDIVLPGLAYHYVALVERMGQLLRGDGHLGVGSLAGIRDRSALTHARATGGS